MDQIIPWIVRIVGGAVGGNAAGAVLKKFSLGKIGNTIVGMLGGGIGATLLSWFGVIAKTTEGTEPGELASNTGAAAAGGGVLMVILGAVKKFLGGKKKS